MSAKKFKVLVADELNPDGLEGLRKVAQVDAKVGLPPAELERARRLDSG